MTQEELIEFKKIELRDFDKSWVNWDKPRLSVSKVKSLLTPEFDKVGVATKCSKKGFNDPSSKYYQMTPEMIIESWNKKGEESMSYGRLVDEYAELSFVGGDIKKWKEDNNWNVNERLQAHVHAMDAFKNRLTQSGDIVFVDRERDLYLETKNGYVRGRLDALFYNERLKKWIIIDWKTDATIESTPSKWTEKLYGPMSSYPNMSLWLYTLQLYTYKLALLKHYLPHGTKVISSDDVSVMVVNLPKAPYHNINAAIGNQDDSLYKAFTPAFEFDENLLYKTYDWCFERENESIIQPKINQEIYF